MKLNWYIKYNLVERLKPDLYGLLEGMFPWRQFFKNFKIKVLLLKTYTKSAQNVNV